MTFKKNYMKYNQKQFEQKLVWRTGASKKSVEEFMEAFKSVMKEELVDGNSINLTGFFHIETVHRKERGGINPQKPSERITIPAVTVTKVRIRKVLRDAIKG